MMEACNEYFTRISCEKLESNLKFYRSLNTRRGPSKYLDRRVHDCMVSYRQGFDRVWKRLKILASLESAATTNNAVGRVGLKALKKVFESRCRNIKSCVQVWSYLGVLFFYAGFRKTARKLLVKRRTSKIEHILGIESRGVFAMKVSSTCCQIYTNKPILTLS